MKASWIKLDESRSFYFEFDRKRNTRASKRKGDVSKLPVYLDKRLFRNQGSMIMNKYTNEELNEALLVFVNDLLYFELITFSKNISLEF